MDYLSFDSSTAVLWWNIAYTIVCVFYDSGIPAKRKLPYQSSLNGLEYFRIECMNIIGSLHWLRGIPCIVGVYNLGYFQRVAMSSQFPPFQKAVLEPKGEIENGLVLLLQEIGNATVVGNLQFFIESAELTLFMCL